MKRLKLSDWSQIADIGAALAVIVSLVFVGFQIRDNTEALRSQNERALVNALQKLELNRAVDVEYAELALRAETGGQMSALDHSRIAAMSFLYIDNWEQAFHDHKKGLIDQDVWKALDNWLKQRLEYAYFREIVAEAAHSGTYSDDFSSHMRAVLSHARAESE